MQTEETAKAYTDKRFANAELIRGAAAPFTQDDSETTGLLLATILSAREARPELSYEEFSELFSATTILLIQLVLSVERLSA